MTFWMRNPLHVDHQNCCLKLQHLGPWGCYNLSLIIKSFKELVDMIMVKVKCIITHQCIIHHTTTHRIMDVTLRIKCRTGNPCQGLRPRTTTVFSWFRRRIAILFLVASGIGGLKRLSTCIWTHAYTYIYIFYMHP